MKIIFSPSKSQVATSIPGVEFSKPKFLDEQKELRGIMQSLSRNKLKKFFNASDKKVYDIVKMYDSLEKENGHALATFTGTSFSQLSPSKYSKECLDYAQGNVVILSALYGALSPLDEITPYRLDMNDPFSTVSYSSEGLYQFWSPNMIGLINGKEQVLNLASLEYSKMLPEDIRENMTTVSFLVKSKGGYKSVAVNSKQERGKMLDFIIKNQVTEIETLKTYSSDQFFFSQEKSTEKEFVFVAQ